MFASISEVDRRRQASRAVVPNLFNVMDPFENFFESCGPLK